MQSQWKTEKLTLNFGLAVFSFYGERCTTCKMDFQLVT